MIRPGQVLQFTLQASGVAEGTAVLTASFEDEQGNHLKQEGNKKDPVSDPLLRLDNKTSTSADVSIVTNEGKKIPTTTDTSASVLMKVSLVAIGTGDGKLGFSGKASIRFTLTDSKKATGSDTVQVYVQDSKVGKGEKAVASLNFSKTLDFSVNPRAGPKP